MSEKFKQLQNAGVDLEHCFMHYEINGATFVDEATGDETILGPSEKMFIIPHTFIDEFDSIFLEVINDISNIITNPFVSPDTPDDNLSDFLKAFGGKALSRYIFELAATFDL